MIDAHAVWDRLQELLKSSLTQQRETALEQYLLQLSLKHERDSAGNHFFVIPGKSERTVAISSFVPGDTYDEHLAAWLGIVTGVETLRALAHRFDGGPPCTLLLAIWAQPTAQPASPAETAISTLLSRSVTAYLGMHIETTEQFGSDNASLGVVSGDSSDSSIAFNSRLSALCDESVRELTGTSVSSAVIPDEIAKANVRSGIPTALMYVDVLATSAAAGTTLAEQRIHLLQAAEAFSRWTEATLQLVAGDEVDLWARERRLPHIPIDSPSF